MSKFTETVHADTPKFVVQYRTDGTNQEFSWGMSKVMPMLSLIGAIARVQGEIGMWLSDPRFDEGDPHYCDMMALVLAWDAESKTFNWFVNPAIPLDPLLGILEVTNVTLTSQHIMREQQAAAATGIIGPDGRPVRRGMT